MQSCTWNRSSCGNPFRSAKSSTASPTRSSSRLALRMARLRTRGGSRLRVRGRFPTAAVPARPAPDRGLAGRCPGRPPCRARARSAPRRRSRDGSSPLRSSAARAGPRSLRMRRLTAFVRSATCGMLTHEIERQRMLREAQVPVQHGIWRDVVTGEAEDVHRRSRVFRRKPRGAEQAGQCLAILYGSRRARFPSCTRRPAGRSSPGPAAG